KGDLEGAVAVYRELTTLDPPSAEAFYNLGMALKQKDDFAGAEEALRRAVAIDPALPEAHYMLGTVLRQQGKVDDALAEFRTAIGIRDSAEPHLNIGQILQQRGDREGA